eukprot:6182234-Pleurochrysis_carterae.AAC.4
MHAAPTDLVWWCRIHGEMLHRSHRLPQASKRRKVMVICGSTSMVSHSRSFCQRSSLDFPDSSRTGGQAGRAYLEAMHLGADTTEAVDRCEPRSMSCRTTR